MVPSRGLAEQQSDIPRVPSVTLASTEPEMSDTRPAERNESCISCQSRRIYVMRLLWEPRDRTAGGHRSV